VTVAVNQPEKNVFCRTVVAKQILCGKIESTIALFHYGIATHDGFILLSIS
jgi:hypothetical protein